MTTGTEAAKERLLELAHGIKGRIYSEATSPPVADSDVRKWAMAVYWPEKPPRQYWDREYAGNSRWRGMVAPVEFNPFAWPLEGPCHLPAWPDFCHAELSFSAGNEAEYHCPIRPGDVITGTSAIVDVYEKQGRSGDLVFVVTESRLTNHRGELVKLLRHPRVFIYQRPGDPARAVERAAVVPVVGPDEDPHLKWASPAPPDKHTRFFEDVDEGDCLPLFQRYTDLMSFNRFAAVNDEFVYHHMDIDVANSRGQKDVDGMGLLQFSYLHNLLRQWIGEDGDIRRAQIRYRANNGRGDIVSSHGRVIRAYREGGLNLVDVEMWTENQRGETLSPGSATVSLPSWPTTEGA